MSDQFELQAELREDKGKGSSRRLRRLADQIPAIVYGAGKDPKPLTLIRKDLEKALENEAFYTNVLTINVGKSKEKAILKDLQRHPAKDMVMHADFLRVDEKVEIKMTIPLHFINEDTCKGVKLDGGMIQHQVTEIDVLCLPSNIPEYIEVDMAEREIGDIVHLSDITLPEHVTSIDLRLGEEHDLALASVQAPKVELEIDDEAPVAPEGDADEGDSDADEGDEE